MKESDLIYIGSHSSLFSERVPSVNCLIKTTDKRLPIIDFEGNKVIC